MFILLLSERTLAVNTITVNKIVNAACTLHSWLIKTPPRTYLPTGSVSKEIIGSTDILPGQWR